MRSKASPQHRVHQLHRVIAGAAWLVLGTLAATEIAAQPRTCVRATIEEPFTLPDGSIHPAGLLRICLERDYSPVAALHTVVAGDRMTGRFLSRRTKAEGVGAASPLMAFARGADGALVLRGYTLARSGEVEVYWIEPPRGRRASSGQSLVVQAPAPPAETVWLAAAVTR